MGGTADSAAGAIREGFSSLEDTFRLLQGDKGATIRSILSLLERQIEQAEKEMEKIFPAPKEKPDGVEFSALYAKAQRCDSMRELFHLLDTALLSLQKVAGMEDEEDEDEERDSQPADADAYRKAAKVDDTLRGFFYAAGVELSCEPLSTSALTIRGVRQVPGDEKAAKLLQLYRLVLALYETFQQVVRTNSLYAAFASDDGRNEKGLPFRSAWRAKNLEAAIGLAEKAAARRYIPDPLLLDDSMEEHVEAFWAALEALCRFAHRPLAYYTPGAEEKIEPQTYLRDLIRAHYRSAYRAVDDLRFSLRDVEEAEVLQTLRILQEMEERKEQGEARDLT